MWSSISGWKMFGDISVSSFSFRFDCFDQPMLRSSNIIKGLYGFNFGSTFWEICTTTYEQEIGGCYTIIRLSTVLPPSHRWPRPAPFPSTQCPGFQTNATFNGYREATASRLTSLIYPYSSIARNCKGNIEVRTIEPCFWQANNMNITRKFVVVKFAQDSQV